MTEYYNLLSSLSAWITGPLTQFSDQINIPIVSALLLGLIAAASPCQLSTNVAALAYVGRRLGSPRALWPSALAYLAGKALTYTILGVAAVVLGRSLNQAAIPIVVVLRKALGPAFLLFGLFMLGVVKLNVNLGGRVAETWRERVGVGRAPDAFVLGVVLALVFCPTMFWLFFGVLIPLSLTTISGPLLPAAFAAGATLPLLIVSGLLVAGGTTLASIMGGARRLDAIVRPLAGIIFLLVGINEIVLYWLAA